MASDPTPTPAPSPSALRDRAFAVYTPPFRFEGGYVWDAKRNMVADDKGDPLRVRGWGRISYMQEPEGLQDAVGALIAEALTAHWNTRAPVSGAEREAGRVEAAIVAWLRDHGTTKRQRGYFARIAHAVERGDWRRFLIVDTLRAEGKHHG